MVVVNMPKELNVDWSKIYTEEDFKEMETWGIDNRTYYVFKRRGYKLIKMLNQGAFGKVYAANMKEEKVAVKVMDLQKVGEKFKKKFLPREISALIGIKHESVMFIHEIFQSNNKMYIFMEWANGGDITGYLKKNGPIQETLTCFWFTQVSNALQYIHETLYIAHRDIKIDNILLHENNAKLTDFGFAKKCYDTETSKVVLSDTYCGTEPYYSPQLVLRKPYNGYQADSWAMGVTLFAMLNNKYPFHFGNRKKMLAEQTDPDFIKSRYAKKVSDEVKDLITRFFEIEEVDRITMAQVMEHLWIVRKGKI